MKESEKPSNTGLLSGKTVLIVDDEPMIRKLVDREFSPYGCRILEAENALDALFLIQENTIDIIISDVKMSGGDGIELLKALEANQSENPPVIIMISAFSNLTEKEAENYGADALLQKPLSIKSLPNLVSKFLGQRAGLA